MERCILCRTAFPLRPSPQSQYPYSEVLERSSKNYVAESIYPVEYEDFGLIPEFTYYGDKVTYQIGSSAETDLISGETKIPFTESNRACTITVYKGSNKAVYTVTTKYTFDPDTIRSITDFRFYRNTNPNIKDVAIASIANEGDKGYITVTVNYDGAKPDVLTPTFLSPGNVSVGQVAQQSGISSQDFSSPIGVSVILITFTQENPFLSPRHLCASCELEIGRTCTASHSVFRHL